MNYSTLGFWSARLSYGVWFAAELDAAARWWVQQEPPSTRQRSERAEA